MATSRGAVCCSRCRARLSSRLHHRRARRSGAGHRHLLLRPARVGYSRRLGRLQRRRQGRLLPPHGRRASCSARSRPAAASAAPSATPALDAGYPRAAHVGRRGRQRRRRLLPPRRQPVQPALPVHARLAGAAFTMQSAGAALEWGDVNGTALADATGDGKADFCRVTANQAICSPLTADGFGAGLLHAGRPGGRWRAAPGSTSTPTATPTSAACSGVLTCALSSRTAPFGGTLSSGSPGSRLRARPRRGRTSTATVAPTTAARSATAARTSASSCTLATAVGLRRQLRLPAAGVGRDDYAWWTSTATADSDFCRTVGRGAVDAAVLHAVDAGRASATRSRPARSTSATPSGRAWVDHNGDGKADYCRLVGAGGTDQRSPARRRSAPRSARCPGRPAAASARRPPPPVKKTRLVVTLSYDYSVKGRYTRLHAAAGQGRARGRDGQGHVQEGLLAQVLQGDQEEARDGVAQDAWSASGCGPGRPSAWWSADPATSPRSRR